MPTLTGHCHCGNIKILFDTELILGKLSLRACQCSFCRSHGAVTTADPRGKLRITATDRETVQHYRFGLGITDVLICKRCGNYVAGVIEANGQRYATLNANLLDGRAELNQPPQPVNYDGETAEQRRARRKTSWTPLESGSDLLQA